MKNDFKEFSTLDYWERRYSQGGNSGSGSFGVLANYKAAFLNDTIKRLGIQSVIDFGCGDGAQISQLACQNYTGVDASQFIIEACRKRYANKKIGDFSRWMTIIQETTTPHSLSM